MPIPPVKNGNLINPTKGGNIMDTMIPKEVIQQLRKQLQEVHDAYEEEHGKDYEEGCSPLACLGEAIDNGELPGLSTKYKCSKCNREAKWKTYIGIPRRTLPCGCGGTLIMLPRNK